MSDKEIHEMEHGEIGYIFPSAIFDVEKIEVLAGFHHPPALFSHRGIYFWIDATQKVFEEKKEGTVRIASFGNGYKVYALKGEIDSIIQIDSETESKLWRKNPNLSKRCLIINAENLFIEITAKAGK